MDTKVDRVEISRDGITFGFFQITQLKEARIIADNMNYYAKNYQDDSQFFDVKIRNILKSQWKGYNQGRKVDLKKYKDIGLLDKPVIRYKYSARL